MWLLKPFSSMCIVVAEKNHVNIKINVPLFAILRPERSCERSIEVPEAELPGFVSPMWTRVSGRVGRGVRVAVCGTDTSWEAPVAVASCVFLLGRQQVLQNLNCSSGVTVLEEDRIPCSQAAPGLVQHWSLENRNKKYHGVCAHVLCAGFLWLPLSPSAVLCDAQNEGCFSHQVDTGSTGSRCGLGHGV